MAALPIIEREYREDGEEMTLEQEWVKYHDLFREVRNLPRPQMIRLLRFILDELLPEQELAPAPRESYGVNEKWGLALRPTPTFYFLLSTFYFSLSTCDVAAAW